MLEKTELPDFICRFLRRIYNKSTTNVEFSGTTPKTVLHGQGRETRLSCERLLVCDGFLIFRWLQDAITPRNPAGLDFLQPAQCAYADDLAVAASSFRDLMTALAPAFHSVDHIAGLNLNYRKCSWVQCGSERRESLLHWLSDNCEAFREMQVVRYGKYVGTMIGPDGHLDRWTAHRKNHPARSEDQRFHRKPG